MTKKIIKRTSSKTIRTSTKSSKKNNVLPFERNSDEQEEETTRRRPILTIETWNGRSLMAVMAPIVANE